jgi:hypothetical protein
MFFNLKTTHYWKSGSRVPDIPVRGYQMIQYIAPRTDPDRVAGVEIDRNVTVTDALGGTVSWLIRGALAGNFS